MARSCELLPLKYLIDSAASCHALSAAIGAPTELAQPKRKNPMTKKDFEIIAAIISTMSDRETTRLGKKYVIGKFAADLAASFPRFDVKRFTTACNQ